MRFSFGVAAGLPLCSGSLMASASGTLLIIECRITINSEKSFVK
jgi:hypothetical protein